MSVTLNFGEVVGLEAKMRRFSAVFSKKERVAQEFLAALLLANIKMAASGSPGPEVRSGAYVDSWFKVYMGLLQGWKVATFSPYAARLEYGFVGTDSLGRNYNQGPLPHVRPAVMKTAPMAKKMYTGLASSAWREA